jgi:hypothetical protein
VFIFYLFKLFIIPKEGQPITAVWRNSRHAASQPFGYCRLSAKRSIPLLIIYPLHNRLVFGSSFKPFYLGSDVVTVHFGYADAHGFWLKFAPLVSVGVWSYHFFALLRCDVAAQVSVAVVKITSRIDAIGFVLWGHCCPRLVI